MAKSDAVWGIDLGLCALKALRCRLGSEPNQIVADAFDYIEYPKILSQPEADSTELIREALAEFLSRNRVIRDRVAISVPGQTGLARFIKLPPVESKKIPDIVRYEARQQIPFALEDVVWDYQQMAGGTEEDGFALETEVGLFAMKREQVYRSLEPFTGAGIDVDFLQLTPLALYNFIAFEELYSLPPPAEFDPENPPESLVLVSLGTDTTDLVITNGYRVWQRSIPLGGSHFTKVLTKELKLTFAKAEQLKRNVDQAPERKAVFQAMRPMFNDLITEIQRSINHFRNLDRSARIQRVIALGNAMKLPGLQRYMKQQLDLEVQLISAFRGIAGAGVVDAPVFKENILSFATCYGLALQGLRSTPIRTNLIPKEILRERLIASKKPWAVGIAATLLLGLGIGTLGDWRAWSAVNREEFTPQGTNSAVAAAKRAVDQAQQHKRSFDEATAKLKAMQTAGTKLAATEDDRLLWLEMMQAVNSCLPSNPPDYKEPADLKQRIAGRNRIYIRSMDSLRFENLSTWYTAAKAATASLNPVAPAATPAPGSPPTPGAPPAPTTPQAPTGAGWVIELRGYHYHNEDRANDRANYLRSTILKNLSLPEIEVPGHAAPFPVGKLGIGFPLLVEVTESEESFADPEAAAKPRNAAADDVAQADEKVKVVKYEFTIQFAWTETLPSKRKKDETTPGAAAPDIAVAGVENEGP